MEGRRCRDVIWGRKGMRVLQRGGSPDCREGRERENYSALAITQGKLFPKAIDWAEYLECLQPVELSGAQTTVLEFYTLAAVEPSRCCSDPVEKEGRGLGTDSTIRILLGHWERSFPLLRVHL